MSEHLLFDKLFDKLESLGEDIGDLKGSHKELKTEICTIKEHIQESKAEDAKQNEAIADCHKRHDKIEGALKFGAWVVGIFGISAAYKLAKEVFG